MKKCGRCKTEKLEAEFRKQTKAKTGLQNYCRQCQDKYNEDRPLRNRPGYYKWYAKTPHGCYRTYKGNAKTRNHSFTITFEDFMALWQKPCTYCGTEIGTIGIDRVNNEKGYEIGNIIPCCDICNYMKRGLSQQEFLERCTQIAEHTLREPWQR